jgi:hypothetical protein
MRDVAALSLLAVAFACSRLRPASERKAEWVMIRPPEVADAQAPRGYHLVPTAPESEWLHQACFASQAECDEAREANAETAIVRARASLGDDAKFDLDVRRAVNARCVRAER